MHIKCDNGNLLDAIVKFALKSYTSNSKIAIILPNYLTIEIAKRQFISEMISSREAFFLPTFMDYSTWIASSNNHLFSLTYHQKIISLIKIILSYRDTKYTATQAIEIAPELLTIYEKLKLYKISYKEIESWVEEDLALHWWSTAKFIYYCFEDFEKKISSYSYHHKKHNTYIVGATEADFKRLSQHIEYGNVTYILPDTQNQKCENIAKYIEFSDIFEETDYITWRALNSDGKTLIILSDNNLYELLCSKFKCYNLEYNSTFGVSYNNFIEAELLYNLAKFKSSSGSYIDFLALLNSKALSADPKIDLIKKTINRFEGYIVDFQQISQYIKSQNAYAFNDFLSSIENFLYTSENTRPTDPINIRIIFSELIEMYNFFAKNFELKNTDIEKFENYIQSIVQLKDLDFYTTLEDLSSLLFKLFAMKYTKPFDKEAKIFIVTPEEARLIDSDYVIFADFNQSSYLSEANHDSVWLSQKIQKKLGISLDSDNFDSLLELSKDKITNSNVTFTRATYKEGESTEACSILNHFHESIIQEFYACTPKVQQKNILEPLDVSFSSILMPKILYASNVELLARDPYGFFARKVLNLYEYQDQWKIPKQKEFGLIVHEMLHLTTIMHQTQGQDESAQVYHLYMRKDESCKNHMNDLKMELGIIEGILEKHNIPSKIWHIWRHALLKILHYHIRRNETALSSGFKIYTEITGMTNLEISADERKTITIKAIADRIEVSNTTLRIIDYKTGQPPSKIDVLSGKCPQLIIEAIIMHDDGFGFSSPRNMDYELVYIKVNTKEPYFEETVITITSDEIVRHKAALKSLLKYYYSKDSISLCADYLPDFWRPSFDSYSQYRRCNHFTTA